MGVGNVLLAAACRSCCCHVSGLRRCVMFVRVCVQMRVDMESVFAHVSCTQALQKHELLHHDASRECMVAEPSFQLLFLQRLLRMAWTCVQHLEKMILVETMHVVKSLLRTIELLQDRSANGSQTILSGLHFRGIWRAMLVKCW